MSNIPEQSCYFINTTGYEIFTLSTASSLDQGSILTQALSITLTKAQVSFQNMESQYLTNISSWCPSKDKAFTFDSSLPNTFYINYGSQTISLDNLQYCGSPIPSSLSYSFFNTTAQSGIALVPNQPIIQITEALKGGTYKGRVAATGTTISGTQQAIVNYTIIVNMPPYFISSLSAIKVQRGSSNIVTYSLPPIKDDENHAYTFKVEMISVNHTDPSLTCLTLAEALADTTVIVFDSVQKKFIVDARNTALPDEWLCDFYYNINLTDSYGATSPNYSLKISIRIGNMPPYWVYDPPDSVVIHLGEELTIDLPENLDPNGDTITHIEDITPPYAVVPVPFKYSLTPYLKEHLGFVKITGNLTDGQTPSENLTFSINVTVVNFAPYFAEELVNQTQLVEEFKEYQLPLIIDQERNAADPVYISVCVLQSDSNCIETLPGFIDFVNEERLFQFKGLIQNKGNYTIQIKLTDKFDNYSLSNFTLRIVEYTISQEIQGLANQLSNTGPPEFVTPIPSAINIVEGKSEVLKFPEIKDPDNDQFECTVNLGSAAPFVIFKDLSLVISPLSQNVAETPYTVLIMLKDKNENAPKINKLRLDISVAAKMQSTNDTSNSTSEYFIEEEEEIKGTSSASKNVSHTNKERFFVRLRLLEVTNLGRARIKVYSKSSTKLMSLISNATFAIKMISNELIEDVPFAIESSYSNILVLKLAFKDPQIVSSSASYDKLVVTTKKQILISTSSYIEVLQTGIILESFIPTQISEQAASKLVLIQKSGDYASYALVSSNLLLNLFLQARITLKFLQLWNPLLSFRPFE
ncbi:hypothetical protein FGO68_gene16481 [Halteria grandinella]|uniref:Uncharacterized protein n=1 Tax=Halteria grandinella TaxID=5974 RepID=A0A8J8NAP8_HALGN|nr:hypothetical protein FGO68_gene16481 [Halteria grandinella]